MNTYKIFQKKLPGFSLIEIAFVLIIIGILAGASFKGKELLDNARLNAAFDEINKVILATTMYKENYDYWPGDDPNAQDNFGANIVDGDGDNMISEAEAKQFWSHLHAAELLDSPQPPQLKIGGSLQIKSSPNNNQSVSGPFLALQQENGEGTLTPLQAQHLLKKFPSHKSFLLEGTNGKKGECALENGRPNLKNKKAVCVLYVGF